MNCDEIIKSNDTYDIIIVTEALERIIEVEPDCIQKINDSYAFYYYNRTRVPPLSIETYTYSAIPKCLGLLDTTALEESGIIQVQNQSALSLRDRAFLLALLIRESPMKTIAFATWTEAPASGQSGTKPESRWKMLKVSM